MKTSAIVLAAGESRRMGQPKMLLPWGRSTVLGTVVSNLLQTAVDEVIVVLGCRSGEVATALTPFAEDARVRAVLNLRYQAGMLTSIQCGARAVSGGNLLIALGDQPLVTAEAVDHVLQAHAGGLTVPVFDGRRGHPVGIDQSLVPDLLALPESVGMRGLFQAYPDRVTMTDVTSVGVLIDLDTPDDYERFRPQVPANRVRPEGVGPNVLRGAAG